MRALAECPEHRTVLDKIAAEVRSEMLTKHSTTDSTLGGSMVIGHRVAERSMAYLRAVYGVQAGHCRRGTQSDMAAAVDEYCGG